MLQLWLHFSDMEVLGVYGELSEQPVQPEDLRAVFVARPMVYEDGCWCETIDMDTESNEEIDFIEE